MKSGNQRLNSILLAAHLRLGVPDSQAVELAEGIVRIMSRHFAGERLYVCQFDHADERNAQIVAARYAGETIGQLAKRFGLSRAGVFKVLRSHPVHSFGVHVNDAAQQTAAAHP